MRTNRFIPCILVLAALVVPAQAADVKPVVVPFEMLPTGHMTVMVKINGKGPYKLIFDTGAPMVLLNNKIAKETNLLKDVKKPLISLFGTMGDVKVPELQVGDQKIENTTAIVMDHPTVKAISDVFGPIDGIVGFPFFARFNMTLDYQAKTMAFVPNGFDPPDVMKSMQAAVMSMMRGKKDPVMLSTAAQWGLAVEKKDSDEDAGVTVRKVLADSPAAKAGLKEGDRILTIDGRWTDSVADTFRAAAGIKAGKGAKVVLKRDGKEQTVQVTPAAGM